MNNKKININEKVLTHYSYGKFKTIYIYSVTSYLLAGYGYSDIQSYINNVCKFLGISSKTAKRWITILKENKLINIRKGTIYIKGRKNLEKDLDTTQRYIKYYISDLKSYNSFQKHTIRQLALLKQRRMTYAIRELNIDDATSLVNTGKIETELAVVKSAKTTGCSISQLEKTSGFNKATISIALTGFTKKQYGKTHPIKGTIARVKYKGLFQDLTLNKKRGVGQKWSFIYNPERDEYIIRYALASRIQVEPALSRKR